MSKEQADGGGKKGELGINEYEVELVDENDDDDDEEEDDEDDSSSSSSSSSDDDDDDDDDSDEQDETTTGHEESKDLSAFFDESQKSSTGGGDDDNDDDENETAEDHAQVATDQEATEKEATEREASEKEATEREATEKEDSEREATEKDGTEREATEKEETDREATEKDEAGDFAESEGETKDHSGNEEDINHGENEGTGQDESEHGEQHLQDSYKSLTEGEVDQDDKDATEGDDEESENDQSENESDEEVEEVEASERSEEEGDDDEEGEVEGEDGTADGEEKEEDGTADEEEREKDEEEDGASKEKESQAIVKDEQGDAQVQDVVGSDVAYQESEGEEYHCPLDTVDEVSDEQIPSDLGESDEDMPQYVPNISQRDDRLSNYDEDEMPDDELAAFEEISRDGPRRKDLPVFANTLPREVDDEDIEFQPMPTVKPALIEAESPPSAEPEIALSPQKQEEPVAGFFPVNFDSNENTVANDIEANEAATQDTSEKKEANRNYDEEASKSKRVSGDGDDDENLEDDVRRFQLKLAMFACGIIAILIAVAIIVPVVVFAGRSNNSRAAVTKPTFSPTANPTLMTFAPTSQSRINATILYLSGVGVSSKYDLEKAGSTQHLAAIWLAEKDPAELPIPPLPSSLSQRMLSLSQRMLASDAKVFVARYIVVLLYYALSGSTWGQQLSFLSEENICEWKSNVTAQRTKGVSCSGDLDVVGIDFSSNNVTGTVPTELGYLKTLTSVNFDFNTISGELPSTIQELTNLTSLSFRHNNLVGSIPSWLDKLTGLVELGLSSNSLNGQLPQALGSLTGLEKLYVDNNALTGGLGVIDPLTRMQYLYLDNNGFVVNTEAAFFNDLGGLVELGISGLGLTGTLPTTFFQKIRLEVLDAHGNNITGTFPDALPPNGALQFLALHQNALQGSLPSSLQSLTRLKLLELAENLFEGALPELGFLSALEYLHLGLNRFSAGPIPSSFSQLTSLRELSLKGTSRSGKIPDAFGSMKGLTLLDLDENALTGTIPSSLGALSDLSFVLLSRNQLTGTIPTELSALPSLEIFLAFQNNIIGSASPVCNITSLQLCAMDCQGVNAEVTCDCCSLCCEDGITCIDSPLIANFDPQWESNNARTTFNFSGIIIIGAGAGAAPVGAVL